MLWNLKWVQARTSFKVLAVLDKDFTMSFQTLNFMCQLYFFCLFVFLHSLVTQALYSAVVGQIKRWKKPPRLIVWVWACKILNQDVIWRSKNISNYRKVFFLCVFNIYVIFDNIFLQTIRILSHFLLVKHSAVCRKQRSVGITRQPSTIYSYSV